MLTLVQPEQTTADVVHSLVASQQAEPLRHPAGVAVRRARDLDDDRLSRRAGDRRRLPEGLTRLRCRGGARRRWSPAPTYAPYGGLGDYMRSRLCADRPASPRRPPRRSNTPMTTGPSPAWPAAMGKTDIAERFEQARRQLAQQLRREERLAARAQAPTARSARRSIRPRSTTARTIPRAMPGSIAGSCRRTRPGCSRCSAATRKAIAKLDAMFDFDNSKLDYSHAEDIAGPDRPIYPRQRAEPPRRLSLRLRGRAVAHAGAAEADRRQPVQADARRPFGQ